MSRNYKIKNKKYNTEYCDDSMTFQECELAILRHAVDESEKRQGYKIANSEDVKKIIAILEKFLIDKKLVCYGGTAINNILPKSAQFYNKDIEIPDYDFFSPNALEDAIELTNIYYKAGYQEVEAKSGVHYGTFKVFVQFIPVADITYMIQPLFKAIQSEAITIAGIKYAPPNFLRMSMYLELSRPAGDVSRWEKVFKRLTLLNKHYPMTPNLDCSTVDFQRKMDNPETDAEKIYMITRDCLIEQGAVFFGGYASSVYSRYMPANTTRKFANIPDFDVLIEDIERCALILQERLEDNGFKSAQIYHEETGELIPEHMEILVGKDSIVNIFSPIACHNYNIIKLDGKEINIATIDTMLSFYLAFIYSSEFSEYKDRILCMAQYLFDVEEENKLEQKGILTRYSMNCIGKQAALEDIRAEKAAKFLELKDKKDSREYKMWFLKYNPEDAKRLKNVEPKQNTRKLHNTVKPRNSRYRQKKIQKKRRRTKKLFGLLSN